MAFYRRSTPGSRLIGSVLGILAGAAITLFAGWGLWQGHLTQAWPSADGQVLASRVETYRSTKGRTKTRGRISYQYGVGGRTYGGSRWNVNESYAPTSAVDQNPVGTAVSVFYDPANPTESVLVRGAGSNPYLFLLVGILFLGISGWTYREAAAALGLSGGAAYTGRLYRYPRADFQPDAFLK